MIKKLLVANWKSNKTQAEAKDWLKRFVTPTTENLLTKKNVQAVVAPPFVFLDLASDLMNQNQTPSIALATQDLSPYPAGSYTGAISAVNLDSLSVGYAIVGHSERRRYFHETDNDVALKVEQALANKITPIVCVGRDNIETQATKLDPKTWSRCLIAYEPESAIGSGMAQDVDLVKQAINQIHYFFSESVPVLYGGSVTELNVNDYLFITAGVLVGSASLDVDHWLNLIKAVKSPSKL